MDGHMVQGPELGESDKKVARVRVREPTLLIQGGNTAVTPY